MQTVEMNYAELGRPQTQTWLGPLHRLERKKLAVLLISVAIAFCFRAYKLDAAGLAEDETNKLFAVRSYEQGDFTVNADHPMMMKMLCYCSINLSRFWNQAAGQKLDLVISEETALRLPNVTFGALTVVPLFLFTSALFGFRIGLTTAFMWSVGLNAVWINRVAKEDTLLVFFMFTGFYLYNCAKERPASDVRGQELLYTLTGAAFGLMIASKYFPHYFGLAVLFYHLVGYHSENNRARTRRMTVRLFGSMILAFVIFNPALFVPQTWRYLSKYMTESLITHHGYLFMDTIYSNDMGSMPHGPPFYYYFLFLAVKLPPPLVAAFLVGLVEIFRHRGPEGRTRGYLFLRVMLFFWLFPMAIAGSKFLRYTLSLMPLVYVTAAVGMSLMWRGLSSTMVKLSVQPIVARRIAATAIAIAFLAAPAVTTLMNLPHPSLYLNSFGGGRVGYFFPHDEFYDVGARESIKYIADTAPQGASVASEIPGVVQYYLDRYDRPDIRTEILSHPLFNLDIHAPDYVILQRGRVYFENEDEYKRIEGGLVPVQTSSYFGAEASRVYRVDASSLH
jgi:hypothetical protein